MSERKVIGTILSGSSTTHALCILRKDAEAGVVREGTLVLIESYAGGRKRAILARVEKIRPIDEALTEGSFLTEALREGRVPPTGLSRRFEVAELDLLFEISDGRKEIVYPPLPRDEVIFITDVEQYARSIFGISEDDMFIEYGCLLGYEEVGLNVLLDLQGLPMHLAVFGTTGSGKSYNVGALIEKLLSIEINEESKQFPIIVIDPAGDYVDYWEYFLQNGSIGNCNRVLRYVFSSESVAPIISSVTSQEVKLTPANYLFEFKIDLNVFKQAPHELAEAIVVYYAGDLAGRELQLSALAAVFEQLSESLKDLDWNTLFRDLHSFRTQLRGRVEQLEISAATRDAALRQLEKFRNEIVLKFACTSPEEAFNEEVIDSLVKEGGLVIIDFTTVGAPKVDLRTKQFIVYYLSRILFNAFVRYKLENPGLQRSLLFILEEAQNYCPNLYEYNIGYSLARSVLQQIATQGRKFGLCLCLISQRPSFVDPVVIGMCNTFLIHRVAPGDQAFVRKVIGGLPESLAARLSRLSPGEVIIIGQMVKSGLPILAKIRYGIDRVVPQKAGRVEIGKGLPKGFNVVGGG